MGQKDRERERERGKQKKKRKIKSCLQYYNKIDSEKELNQHTYLQSRVNG